LHEQNDNTVKDVTPFPDQDNIRHDVARCAYRTKLDMSEAYEQICVRPADIPKTAFATILGTFVSQVMQQRDCNTPSTFQWLMTAIFQEQIRRFCKGNLTGALSVDGNSQRSPPTELAPPDATPGLAILDEPYQHSGPTS
jgi:hypothetical protein